MVVRGHGQGQAAAPARRAFVAGIALHDPPAVVATALAKWFDVDLLVEVLANVADEHGSRESVEREAPRIAQAVAPDLGLGVRLTGVADKRVAFRDPVRVARIDIYAQDFAQEFVQPLRHVARIAARATVAQGD